jgi:hypothetical protein
MVFKGRKNYICYRKFRDQLNSFDTWWRQKKKIPYGFNPLGTAFKNRDINEIAALII